VPAKDTSKTKLYEKHYLPDTVLKPTYDGSITLPINIYPHHFLILCSKTKLPAL